MVLKVLSGLSRRLLYFGDNSNLHGIRFVTEKDRSWACRIFWLCALTSCGYGLRLMLLGTIRSAQEDALSFTPDTNRLLWQTSFPAVTVCEKYNYYRTLSRLSKSYPEFMKQFDFTYRKMFAEMSFGEATCELCATGCGSDFNCSVDWHEMSSKVKMPCSGLIASCTWLERPFNCCQNFLPIDTETGTCFSFNTLQSKLSGSAPRFQSNRSTGPGVLSFIALKNLMVYVHGGEEVPWAASDADMTFETGDSIRVDFRMVEMSNDPLVPTLDLELRKCRFPYEVVHGEFGKSYPIHGYSTCNIDCVAELMFKRCNCIHPLRDEMYKNVMCNYTGLACLHEMAEEKRKMTVEQISKQCDHCLPSCNEIELTRIFYEEVEEDDERVTIRMASLPNIQYRRNVVRTTMDLVVSVGGLAGLFFGASLLSMVEAVYFIFLRKGATR